ncbi:protein phosphatase 2C domain-containing protein [Cohnella cellulosilytica]|uniref:Protein phosphatase 2C domain-containing protein n=1 Tax=Cohnella cellulosilytica TaxID=986710 RepID=A0ABW2FF51_9BACL
MKIEHLSVQGCNEWNEDALILNGKERIYGVLDGATSLAAADGSETGGYLASRTAQRVFEAANGPDISLRSLVLQANSSIRAEMIERGVDADDKQAVWAAGIAVVRIGEHQIEYAQTGDCMLIATYKDGTVRTVTHDQVDHFDENSRRLWERYTQEDLPPEEVRRRVYEVIKMNRLKTNTPEGYAILNGDPALERYVEHGYINRIQLASVLLVTDGLFLPRKAGEPAPAMADMTALIDGKGLAGYVDWLIANEYDESQQGLYTRLKVADDKTAIKIDFVDG